MTLMSRLVQRQLGLDPPLTRDLIIERDLPVPMPDGTVLLADRWAPRTGGDKLPVALMRSPYGRGALMAAGTVRPLAERGFQVILQSARGTFGSGGVFEPMRNEREDGLATLDVAGRSSPGSATRSCSSAPATWATCSGRSRTGCRRRSRR